MKQIIGQEEYKNLLATVELDEAAEARIREAVAAGLAADRARAGGPKEARRSNGRKWLLLAAVLTAVFSLGTAFAVNQEFQRSLVTLFRVEAVEQSPQFSIRATDNERVVLSEARILADQVRVDYLHTTETALISDGVIRVFRDEDLSESDYYTLVEGELQPLDYTTVTWQGNHFGERVSVIFDYAVAERLHINIHYQRGIRRLEGGGGVGVSALGDRTDGVLLHYYTRDEKEVYDNYYTWLDLETMTEHDFLAGCGLEKLGPVTEWMVLPDLTAALVKLWSPDYDEYGIGPYYYVNVENKTTVLLDDLVGVELWPLAQFAETERAEARQQRRPPKRRQVPFASLLKDGTITYGMFAEGTLSMWRYDPLTGQHSVEYDRIRDKRQVTEPIDGGYSDDEREAGGVLLGFLEIRFSLFVDYEGITGIRDHQTGQEYLLQDFTYDDSWFLAPNRSGTKILFEQELPNEETGDLEITNLGVLDLESGRLNMLERNGLLGEPMRGMTEGKHGEFQATAATFISSGWFDDARLYLKMEHSLGEQMEGYTAVYEFLDELQEN